MWWFDRLIEQKIEDGQRQGYFKHLKGEGKPLRDDHDDLAGENWLANHMMQEVGVLPEWLSLRKDISALKPRLQSFREEAEDRLESLPNRLWYSDARLNRLTRLYQEQARKLNLMVDQHNHRCPSIHHELIRVREDAIERYRERLRDRRAKEYVLRSSGEHGR